MRKGFDVLIAALATLADLPWRLTIAGDRTRNPTVAARLDADIATHKLRKRVEVLGAVPDQRIAALYAETDVFVLASRFEGYGMAYAEAIAHGLPVIGTTGGATPETVPGGAGILVAPEDAAALASALRRLIDRSWRARTHGRCRGGCRGSVADLGGIRQTARRRDRGCGMTGFSAAWLALREPHDRRARNAEVLDAVASAFAGHASLNVADLACGTGSTYRALSPHLPAQQRWRLYRQ